MSGTPQLFPRTGSPPAKTNDLKKKLEDALAIIASQKETIAMMKTQEAQMQASNQLKIDKAVAEAEVKYLKIAEAAFKNGCEFGANLAKGRAA